MSTIAGEKHASEARRDFRRRSLPRILCHHNSRHIGLGEGFHESAAVFARKWRHRLHVATPCVIIDQGGGVHLLGNAMPGPRSVAYAV